MDRRETKQSLKQSARMLARAIKRVVTQGRGTTTSRVGGAIHHVSSGAGHNVVIAGNVRQHGATTVATSSQDSSERQSLASSSS